MTKAPTRTIRVKKLDPRARLPYRSLETAVGLDVEVFNLSETGQPNRTRIAARTTAKLKTGLVVLPPSGHYIQVVSRSGLASRSLFVANAPGIIDPDYTGELIILLHNGGPDLAEIWHGMKVAQLLLLPLVETVVVETEETPIGGLRGPAGFGSTGD